MESFIAEYYCKICTVTKEDPQNIFVDKKELYRSVFTYEKCFDEPKRNFGFGIQFISKLNEIKYFKIFDSISADIMHDILEGIGPYELKLFLRCIVKDKK